jgi:hypothetical protein
MTEKEKRLLRRLRDSEVELAKTASETFEFDVVPLVLVTETGQLHVELVTKNYDINELMGVLYPEGIE